MCASNVRIGDTLRALDAEGVETPCRVVQILIVDGQPRGVLLPVDGGHSFVRTAAEVEGWPLEKGAVAA